MQQIVVAAAAASDRARAKLFTCGATRVPAVAIATLRTARTRCLMSHTHTAQTQTTAGATARAAPCARTIHATRPVALPLCVRGARCEKATQSKPNRATTAARSAAMPQESPRCRAIVALACAHTLTPARSFGCWPRAVSSFVERVYRLNPFALAARAFMLHAILQPK